MSRERFDGLAADWDDEDKVARAAEVAACIAGAVTLTPGTRVLEYGAGTGLVAQALAGAVGGLTLADSSSGMRQVMSEKVRTAALPPGTRVWDLDLAEQAPPAGEEFDLVVASLVLHHVRETAPFLDRLVALLAPGGSLCVADLDAEDGSFHAHTHDFDGHDGLDRDTLAEALRLAGLSAVSVADCTSITKEGTDYPVFLATGRR